MQKDINKRTRWVVLPQEINFRVELFKYTDKKFPDYLRNITSSPYLPTPQLQTEARFFHFLATCLCQDQLLNLNPRIILIPSSWNGFRGKWRGHQLFSVKLELWTAVLGHYGEVKKVFTFLE